MECSTCWYARLQYFSEVLRNRQTGEHSQLHQASDPRIVTIHEMLTITFHIFYHCISSCGRQTGYLFVRAPGRSAPVLLLAMERFVCFMLEDLAMPADAHLIAKP